MQDWCAKIGGMSNRIADVNSHNQVTPSIQLTLSQDGDAITSAAAAAGGGITERLSIYHQTKSLLAPLVLISSTRARHAAEKRPFPSHPNSISDPNPMVPFPFHPLTSFCLKAMDRQTLVAL